MICKSYLKILFPFWQSVVEILDRIFKKNLFINNIFDEVMNLFHVILILIIRYKFGKTTDLIHRPLNICTPAVHSPICTIEFKLKAENIQDLVERQIKPC